jgi:hypothetical protein
VVMNSFSAHCPISFSFSLLEGDQYKVKRSVHERREE